MVTGESKSKLESGQLIIHAEGLMDTAYYLLRIVKTKQRVTPDFLVKQADKLREHGDKLIRDHGELLGRRNPVIDASEQEYWRHATEQVVATRERISEAWKAAVDYAVELRYPAGPKGWWYALQRALGFRRGALTANPSMVKPR